MTNHPNRSKSPSQISADYSPASFVIELSNGRLWKNIGADSAAIFSTRANAEFTVAGFSGRGALANPAIREIVAGPDKGAQKVDGYWLRKAR